MKVAVTGASGHIGNYLLRELTKQGAKVRVLVHRHKNNIPDMSGVDIVEGDLLDQNSLDRLCEGSDVVFHLAAKVTIDNRSPGKVYATNVFGTANIIKAVIRSGSGKMIHFSSIHAFRALYHGELLDENSPLSENRDTIYEYSKAEGEREVIRAVKEGLNAVILNPTAVIGPFDYNRSVLGKALRNIYTNKIPFIIKGGYNWVDVRDVAAAAIKSVETGRKGEKYILSGEFSTLGELSVMISHFSGCRVPVQVPVSLAKMAVPFLRLYSSLTGKDPLYTGQSLDILANSPFNISSDKARCDLGFSPRPLVETLKDTFKWYKENNMLK